MAKAETTKLYRTFVKGLITEAGPLTYPEDASIDEDNCIIYRTGNRSRRLGIDTEGTDVLGSVILSQSSFHLNAIQEYRWDSVGGDANLSFLVLQIGTNLHFFDITDEPVVTRVKSFTVNTDPFVVAGVTDSYAYPLSFAAGRGLLFVSGEVTEPFSVQYSSTYDTISTNQIYIQIRDFKGVADGLANDEEPATLSLTHHYNLRNQGWVNSENDGTGVSVTYYDEYGGTGTYAAAASTPIIAYEAAVGRYPGNNKQWWVSKDPTTGAFDPALLKKNYFGTTRAPRGHFVVNAFNIDRSAVSGIAGIPSETISTRPNCNVFAQGRAWWGHSSTLYFSQLLTDKGKAGSCYMEADPTSEDISDLIATDGGVIPIPEMAKVIRLMSVGSGVVAFATNGVWYVSGGQGGFSALDYSVSKISPIGTESPNSIIDVEGQIYWWSKIGIMAMAEKQGMFGSVDGVFTKTNITEQTIQTFYNDIDEDVRTRVKAVYDPLTNCIQWLYQEGITGRPYCYNKILNLDLTLQAFYPWTISREEDVFPDIIGVTTTPIYAGYKGAFNTTVKNTFIKYPVITVYADSYLLSFAEFNNLNFADWATTDGQGLPFTSFVETGYEILEDALRKKQAPWVQVYFKRTEEGYNLVGDDYELTRPSSCMFQVKWDWSSSQISNKYSTKREAYRIIRMPNFDETDLVFDSGFPIVTTKHKVRGSGKSIQFRFENEDIGTDFDLLGWAVSFSGNTKA